MTTTDATAGASAFDILAKQAQNNAANKSSSSSTIPNGDDALASLSGDYSNFLTLLTTQLKNQDPLSPMDSTQFTQQLVQFSAVEQQINGNKKLDQLIGCNPPPMPMARSASSAPRSPPTATTFRCKAASPSSITRSTRRPARPP